METGPYREPYEGELPTSSKFRPCRNAYILRGVDKTTQTPNVSGKGTSEFLSKAEVKEITNPSGVMTPFDKLIFASTLVAALGPAAKAIFINNPADTNPSADTVINGPKFDHTPEGAQNK